MEGVIMSMGKSSFSLLLNKEILWILEGDTEYGEYEPEDGSAPIKIKMPYLTGPTICEISSAFGYDQEYSWNGGALSRWEYLFNLIDFCIKHEKISELLSYLFDKKQFTRDLRGHTADIVEKAHQQIVETVISQINGVLFFGGNEFVVVGKRFVVKSIDKPIIIDAPQMATIQKAGPHKILPRLNSAFSNLAPLNPLAAHTSSSVIYAFSRICAVCFREGC